MGAFYCSDREMRKSFKRSSYLKNEKGITLPPESIFPPPTAPAPSSALFPSLLPQSTIVLQSSRRHLPLCRCLAHPALLLNLGDVNTIVQCLHLDDHSTNFFYIERGY